MRAFPLSGRRGKRVRSAVRAVRERRPPVYDRNGDPEIVSLVDAPFRDVEDVHRRLSALLSAFERRNDRRAVFLDIYARMTEAVANRVSRGDFNDPEWVNRYLVTFADYYREAVRNYERGRLQSLPDPWQLAFEAAERGDMLVIQDALLGINAHINYDLALTLEEVSAEPHPAAKYDDHAAVTHVIEDVIDDAQEFLAERDADGLATLDETLGRIDEQVFVFTIDECRDNAWRTAVALHSRLRVRRRLARWVNDVTATGAGYLIVSSQASDTVHETLTDLEGMTGNND